MATGSVGTVQAVRRVFKRSANVKWRTAARKDRDDALVIRPDQLLDTKELVCVLDSLDHSVWRSFRLGSSRFVDYCEEAYGLVVIPGTTSPGL